MLIFKLRPFNIFLIENPFIINTDWENLSDTDTDTISSEEDSDNYFQVLRSMSKKWMDVQINHDVSECATNSFWQLAFDMIPIILGIKERCNIKKEVPGFIHIRRKLKEEKCPDIHMKFVYLNRSTNSVEEVQCRKAPVKEYPKANYIKLYEEAHIKVNILV